MSYENEVYQPSPPPKVRSYIWKRAQSHCEDCGLENMAYGRWNEAGSFERLNMSQAGAVSIRLTIYRLDLNPDNNRSLNLKLLCPKCAAYRYNNNRTVIANRRRLKPDAIQTNLVFPEPPLHRAPCGRYVWR